LASCSYAPCWLEQLDGVAVGIVDLDLFSAGPRFHVVSETETGGFQGLDQRREILDAKHDSIPTAGLLLLSIGHRPRSGCVRAAEQQVRVTERNARKRGKLLMHEREAQVRRIKRNRASDVSYLVSDPMHTEDE
jgi:hypothetical protein